MYQQYDLVVEGCWLVMLWSCAKVTVGLVSHWPCILDFVCVLKGLWEGH